MGRTKIKRFEAVGMSYYKYKQLLYFVKQYDEKVEKLKSLTCIRSMDASKVRSGSSCGSMTESISITMDELIQDIDLIEHTAMETAGELYRELLTNIIDEVDYIHLNVPCTHYEFYEMRRQFFIKLSHKMAGRFMYY